MLGFRIYYRDTSKYITVWPQDSYTPDTWGNLLFTYKRPAPVILDQPPSVVIMVSSATVQVGDTFQVIIEA